MTRGFLSSARATRIAFFVIITFVTVQMTWWIYFQVTNTEELSAVAVASLEREAASLDALLAAGAVDAAEGLLAVQPQLRLAPDGASVEIDPAERAKLIERQQRGARMLAFEGPFFVLVIMTGLFIISRNLRLERELVRRHQNFLDAVGHEYKTPISSLRLLIETLQLRPALAATRLSNYLDKMSSEVDRLERTGQQVLASARIEAAAERGPLAQLDLAEVVGATLGRLDATFEARGAAVTLRAEGGPVPVLAGQDDLVTITQNLVDNAIKYSPAGRRNVTVRVWQDGSSAYLAVEDEGVGIPREERERVFQRFYRTGDELTRTAPGIGLGLYLVKHAARELGGRVQLRDRPGGGTVVTVTLPLSGVSNASREGEAA